MADVVLRAGANVIMSDNMIAEVGEGGGGVRMDPDYHILVVGPTPSQYLLTHTAPWGPLVKEMVARAWKVT